MKPIINKRNTVLMVMVALTVLMVMVVFMMVVMVVVMMMSTLRTYILFFHQFQFQRITLLNRTKNLFAINLIPWCRNNCCLIIFLANQSQRRAQPVFESQCLS